LSVAPVHALIDGNKVPALPCPADAIVKGDSKVLSIAAASIIAKVTRDRVMSELDLAFPGYGWARNKGYGTADHMEALARLGPSVHHRTSFAPIAQLRQAIDP
jgi:ribonuclease HII